jgi:hypothetical protein
MRLQRVISAILLLAATACADSDGYYCVGRNYVAYQFGLAAPPVRPHRVYVIRLGGVEGIAAPATIEIPQFQVHGMACSDSTIRLEAFDALYTIHLDQLRRPVTYTVERWEDPRNHPVLSHGNQPRLGGFGFSTSGFNLQRTVLLKDETGHEFTLEIEPKQSPSHRCDADITTRIVEADATHAAIRQQVLFTGKGFIADCR